MKLHFICKQGDGHSRTGENSYESGRWFVSVDTANEAIGGRIYLHEKQDEPAWHGGKIIGWYVSPEAPDRKIFQYLVDEPFRIKCKEGWGREKAIIHQANSDAN